MNTYIGWSSWWECLIGFSKTNSCRLRSVVKQVVMVNLEIKHLKLKQSFCSSERHLIKYTPISMPQWTDGHNKFPLADYKVVGCSKLFGKQVECYICKLLECELLLLFCFSMLNDFFT